MFGQDGRILLPSRIARKRRASSIAYSITPNPAMPTLGSIRFSDTADTTSLVTTKAVTN
jgi:hypothetical protein